MSPADDMEGLAEVIAQAAVHCVRTHATVERRVTIAAKQCIAADGAIAGDDVPVVWPVTSIAAVSAREQVAQTGLIAVPPASNDGEKRTGSVAPKSAKAQPDASTRSHKKACLVRQPIEFFDLSKSSSPKEPIVFGSRCVALRTTLRRLTPSMFGGSMRSPNVLHYAVTVLALAAMGCTSATAPPPDSIAVSTGAAAPEYVIGPGDGLDVFVYLSPELSTTALPVRPDGRISLPLVPDIVAAGRSPTQLATDITARLRPYVIEPNVTVMVRNFIGSPAQQVRIIGEATQPRTIPYREGMIMPSR